MGVLELHCTRVKYLPMYLSDYLKFWRIFNVGVVPYTMYLIFL